jgi:hypothetical protein
MNERIGYGGDSGLFDGHIRKESFSLIGLRNASVVFGRFGPEAKCADPIGLFDWDYQYVSWQ